MDVIIERIAAKHIDGFHHAVDVVARERKYLALLEAPPLDRTREFVMNNITNRHPQFVAVAGLDVVGWCDVLPKQRPIYAHSGVLGMGLLAAWRGKGNGKALIETTLNEARLLRLVRVELTVHADNLSAVALYKRSASRRKAS